MKFADFVCHGAITPQLASDDKESVITELVESLVTAGEISEENKAEIIEAIKKSQAVSSEPPKTTAKRFTIGSKTLKAANEGDVKSMELLGAAYRHGQYGMKQDYKLAFEWYDKARQAGSVLAITSIGTMLIWGQGVPKNDKKGFLLLCRAARKGSDYAASWVGMAWVDGSHGLQVNERQAIAWLKFSLSSKCSHKIMNEETRRRAKAKLQELFLEQHNKPKSSQAPASNELGCTAVA